MNIWAKCAALLIVAVFAVPSVALAQQPAAPVVGYLSSGSLREANTDAFRKGLGEAGYVEGRNVAIEFRFAEGRYERLPSMAVELIRRPVAVIFAQAPPAARAAKAATTTIPIVFTSGGDPVTSGLVDSLRRPSGNMTGITMQVSSLVGKRLELLRELLPKATSLALLVNPTNPNAAPDTKEMEEATRALGVNLHAFRASTEADVEAAFAMLVAQQADALLIGTDPFFLAQAELLVSLAARYAVPTAYFWRDFPDMGGLFSYGTSLTEMHRQAGIYAGRLLNGAKPSELPVEQASKFELVVNLKTAKSLGIAIPQSILLLADDVIE
jgi:putative ABC transport system substrate-binding protein